MYFIFHVENEFNNTPFIVEADNILNAHIKFQECLEKIDAGLDEAFPCRKECDCRTTVNNIHEAPFASFSEDWLKEYIESTVEHVIECDDDED